MKALEILRRMPNGGKIYIRARLKNYLCRGPWACVQVPEGGGLSPLVRLQAFERESILM